MKKVPEKQSIGISGISFIIAGVVVMLVQAIFFVILGDFISLIKGCTLPLSSVDIGDGTLVSCMELRFVYSLSYFCVILGLILLILGLSKKILEQIKSFKQV